MLCSLILGLVPCASQDFVHSLGHPDALVITGAEVIDSEQVRRALRNDPDAFDASFPMRRIDDYTNWLQRATTFAYMRAGFPAVVVEVQVEGEHVLLHIEEGPPVRAAALRVEGATQLDVDGAREVLRVGSVNAERVAGDKAHASGSSRPTTFWVPGEPAPLSPFDRERVARLFDEAARASGFRALQFTIDWETNEDTSIGPVVRIVDEGPRSVVGSFLFEGVEPELHARMQSWVDITEGTVASAAVLDTIHARLLATGRFLTIEPTYEDRADSETESGHAVTCRIRVVPNPIAPAIDESLQADLALLVAGMQDWVRLASEPTGQRVGLDLDLTLDPSVVGAASALLAAMGWSPIVGEDASLGLTCKVTQDFVSVEVASRSKGGATPWLQVLADSQQGRVRSIPLGLDLHFGPAELEWIVGLRATVKAVIEDAERPVDMNLTSGVTTGGDAPVRMDLDVHPSTFLYLLSTWTKDAEAAPGELRLVHTFDDLQASISWHPDLPALQGRIAFERDGFVGTGVLGRLDDVEPPTWFGDADAAEAERADGDADGVGATPFRLVELPSLLLSSERLTESHRSVGLLAWSGVRGWMDGSPAGPRTGSQGGPRFHVPRASGPPAGHPFRDMCEMAVMNLIATQQPGSWSEHLLRGVPFIAFPGDRNEMGAAAAMLDQVAKHEDRGPLATWLTAEVCASAGRDYWSKPMAELGLQDLSSAAFVQDVTTLFGPPTDAEQGAAAGRIAAGWQELARWAQDERASADAHRSSVAAVFEGVDLTDLDAVWRTGWTHVWEAALRDLVQQRLQVLRKG